MDYIQNTDFIFDNFFEIVNHYLKNIYPNKNNGKYSFECVYGSIEFHNLVKNNYIIVHEIYIKEIYRNRGLCKDFIKYLIDCSKNKYQIVIQSVFSKILYNFLLKFEYDDYKFILKKDGFYCINKFIKL